jgi:hypothetical protein
MAVVHKKNFVHRILNCNNIIQAAHDCVSKHKHDSKLNLSRESAYLGHTRQSKVSALKMY